MPTNIRSCKRCGKILKKDEGSSYRETVFVEDFEKGLKRKLVPFYFCRDCERDFSKFLQKTG